MCSETANKAKTVVHHANNTKANKAYFFGQPSTSLTPLQNAHTAVVTFQAENLLTPIFLRFHHEKK